MRVKRQQQGLASIVIVFTLLILISLISIGFSRLMNRALRVTVNNQLGSAADYAAQSGINDVADYVRKNPQTTVSRCDELLGTGKPLASSSSLSSTTKYTCALVDPTPSDLAFQNIPAFSSQVVKLNTDSGNGADQLMFSWQANDSSKNKLINGNNTTFYDEASWAANGYAPVLKVTLFPIPAGGSLAGLAANSPTFYFYPNNGSSSPVARVSGNSANANGSVVQANCGSKNTGGFKGTADYVCNVIIVGLNSSYYYARITPLYEPTDVKIKANSNGQAVKFVNVQSTIDVTASSNAAVKRLQARVPTGDATDVNANDDVIPEQGIRSAKTICKRLVVPTAPAGLVIVDPSGALSTSCDSINNTLPAPQVSLTANPTTMPPGNTSTLTWTVTGFATGCDASGDWVGQKTITGGTEQTPVLTTSRTYTYTLTCINSTGPGSGQATVTVIAPRPTVNLTADDTTLTLGQSTTLRWTSTNAVPPCTASGAWTGNSVPVNGSQNTGVFSSAGSFTYTLTCRNSSGVSARDSVTITVSSVPTPPPPPPGPPGSPPPPPTPPPPPPGGGSDCKNDGSSISPGSGNPGYSGSYGGTYSHCYNGCSGFGGTSGGNSWTGSGPGGGSDNLIGYSGSFTAGGPGWQGIRCTGGNGTFDLPIFVNPPPPPPPPGPPPPPPPPGCGFNNHIQAWPFIGSIFSPNFFIGRVIC